MNLSADAIAVLSLMITTAGGVIVAYIKIRPQSKQATAKNDVLVTEAAGQIIGFQKDYIGRLRKDIRDMSAKYDKLEKELDETKTDLKQANERITVLEDENKRLKGLEDPATA